MNDIQLAVRCFMMQSSIGQIKIMNELGYNKDFDYNLRFNENNLLFVKWLKENNKVQDFIDKCKTMYND